MKNKITNYFVNNGILNSKDALLFQHGVDVIGHHSLILLTVIFIGAIVNRILEAIIFVCIYPFLRKYSGGVHAITRKRCYMLTICSFIFFLILNSIVYPIILLCLGVLAGVFLIQKSPLEQPGNPLNLCQIKLYHNNSMRMITLLLVFSIIGLLTHPSRIYTTILLCIIFAAIDMMLEIETKNQHRKIYHLIFCKIVLMVLAVGRFNLQATCDGWKYQPTITANLRKYMDE